METDSANGTLDKTPLTNDIQGMTDCGDPSASQLIYDLGVYLRVYDRRNSTNLYSSYQEFCSALPKRYADLVAIAGSDSRTYIGTPGRDDFKGVSTVNYLFGQDANGNLVGGNGNDVLYGGSGNDTYVIEAGHGDDTIHDTEGVNLILFADCFTEDDFSFKIDDARGFVLMNRVSGKAISIPDFLSNLTSYKFSFGKKNAAFTGSSRDIATGTEANDNLDAGNGFNVFTPEMAMIRSRTAPIWILCTAVPEMILFSAETA